MVLGSFLLMKGTCAKPERSFRIEVEKQSCLAGLKWLDCLEFQT